MIKKLVLSSGTYFLFHQTSAIYHFIKNKFIDIENIEEIYCTSAGSVVGLLVCLGIDFKIIHEYLMSRPWHKLFYLDAGSIFNAYNNCGIYTIQIFIKALEPLFKLKDISLDITMKELHIKSNKKLNIFATNTNTLEKKII